MEEEKRSCNLCSCKPVCRLYEAATRHIAVGYMSSELLGEFCRYFTGQNYIQERPLTKEEIYRKIEAERFKNWPPTGEK